MNKQEQGVLGLAILIVMAFVGLMILLIKLQLVFIEMFRTLFWVDLFLIPISFITMVIFIIFGIREEWNEEIFFIFAGLSLVLLLLSFFTIDNAYNNGYSNQAIQRKAELRKQLQEYQEIMDLITLKKIAEIENQALEETINSMCKSTPNYPCEQMKQNLKIYQKLSGWKSQADKIARIIHLIEKK